MAWIHSPRSSYKKDEHEIIVRDLFYCKTPIFINYNDLNADLLSILESMNFSDGCILFNLPVGGEFTFEKRDALLEKYNNREIGPKEAIDEYYPQENVSIMRPVFLDTFTYAAPHNCNIFDLNIKSQEMPEAMHEYIDNIINHLRNCKRGRHLPIIHPITNIHDAKIHFFKLLKNSDLELSNYLSA